MNNQQKRELEQAANSTTVKDWGSKGLDKHGNPKQGYYRLKDNRVIKTSDLLGKAKNAEKEEIKEKAYDIETEAAKHPDLSDMKNLAYLKNGKLKNGYHILTDGKVISTKQLHEAYINSLEVNK